MIIEIDENSGFCFGVVYAVKRAEEELTNNKELYCLGDIVHNGIEVRRLEKLGLKTIDHEQFNKLSNCTVLLRAHGEPPSTYQKAFENNIKLVDASCPVVLKLQNKIKRGYDEMQEKKGQIVIYGKKGHAEVNGLVGQTQGHAIVVSEDNDLEQIDFSRPIRIYSQTTKSIKKYQGIIKKITADCQKQQKQEDVNVKAYDSICKQVAHRDRQLRDFARKHNVIIFVSGRKSSNGKMLFEICRSENPQTYFVSELQDIKAAWLYRTKSVGICGATSTPRWLMESIYNELNTRYNT